MSVGKVGIACRGPMPPVTEQLADQVQILAEHNGLACYRMPEIVQAKAAELGDSADCAPAGAKRIVALCLYA